MTSFTEHTDIIQEFEEVDLSEGEHVSFPVIKGDFSALPNKVQQFIARYVSTRYRLYSYMQYM